MHVFVSPFLSSSLLYTHTRILFLLSFCSSFTRSICVRMRVYVYVVCTHVCMHVYTMKYVKFLLTFPSLLFRIPLRFHSRVSSFSSLLSLSLFLPVSVVLRRLFFFFSFFFSFDGENSKFPCVLPRGQPLVRFATVGFPTLAKCCKVSLVSISSSPRSVSFFVFAVFRGRFLIGAVWWNHSSFALSVFFEWSVTMIAVKGEFLDLRSERLGNRNRSFKIRLVECSQFSLVNLRWMFEISKFRRRFEDFMKNNKYFRIFAI
mgnify:CR=1 FL=1